MTPIYVWLCPSCGREHEAIRKLGNMKATCPFCSRKLTDKHTIISKTAPPKIKGGTPRHH